MHEVSDNPLDPLGESAVVDRRVDRCYTRGGGSRSRAVSQGEVAFVDFPAFPKCQKCKTGDLVPLSDFGSQGAASHYKAWACTNPECGFTIKIRNGDLYIDEPISSGALHAPRFR